MDYVGEKDTWMAVVLRFINSTYFVSKLGKFELGHWLIEGWVYFLNRKKNKRTERKIYGERGHSWACESEVIVSIDNSIEGSTSSDSAKGKVTWAVRN